MPFWRKHRQTENRLTKRDVVLSTPLTAAPAEGCTYSDVGMMILGFLLEGISGVPLDVLVRSTVCEPLKMGQTRFNPPLKQISTILPTEYSEDGSGPILGTVHDENARWLGGVSGHAGLFSTASDLATLAECIMAGGITSGGTRVWQHPTISLFTTPARIVDASSRCLGWDGYSQGCTGGDHATRGSFGHTGFTGTSLWIDPPARRIVVLLTNAVHPRREHKKNGYFPWRRAIHEAAYALQL